MADTKPTRVEYMFGGRCKGSRNGDGPAVDAILRELGGAARSTASRAN